MQHLKEFLNKPMLNVDLAFQGSFIKNHRNIKTDKIEEIYNGLKDKESLAKTLIEMIQDTYQDLSVLYKMFKDGILEEIEV